MATALQEMARVICQGGRAIVILGHTSRVLGTPFFNADIVESIVCRAGMFDIVQRQQRVFTNRFGEAIREDILSLERVSQRNSILSVTELGRSVALAALTSALETVPTGNYSLLIDSIARINEISATPAFNSLSYADYQSRAQVMMVKEERTQL